MSESKMREALITAREVLRLEGYPDNNVAMVKIHSALALQPVAGVELTDAEINTVWAKEMPSRIKAPQYAIFYFARAVIAAHEAKKNGGGV